MRVSMWNIEAMTGYKPITTFWQDFSIADHFGPSAIKDTFRRAFKEWRGNYKYLTELVMVLNWKIWQYYERSPYYAAIYSELYEKADQWALDNLEGEELTYFIRTTD